MPCLNAFKWYKNIRKTTQLFILFRFKQRKRPCVLSRYHKYVVSSKGCSRHLPQFFFPRFQQEDQYSFSFQQEFPNYSSSHPPLFVIILYIEHLIYTVYFPDESIKLKWRYVCCCRSSVRTEIRPRSSARNKNTSISHSFRQILNSNKYSKLYGQSHLMLGSPITSITSFLFFFEPSPTVNRIVNTTVCKYERKENKHYSDVIYNDGKHHSVLVNQETRGFSQINAR